MKSNIAKRSIELIAFAVALASFAPSAFAQCSLARAAGKYGFSDIGAVLGVGPRAAVGLLTFDASGKLQGLVTASLNGSVSQTTVSGTYEVRADCSGTAQLTESALDASGHLVTTLIATVAIVWDNNMREARFLFTSTALPDNTPLATVISGDAEKLVP